MAEHYSFAGEIDSGTVLIGGVVCEIESGQTLSGGVVRDIEFTELLTITITGSSGNTNFHYVKVNGVKYYDEQVLKVSPGTVIFCNAYFNVEELGSNEGVYLNGTYLHKKEYYHTATTNCTISMETYNRNWYIVYINEE